MARRMPSLALFAYAKYTRTPASTLGFPSGKTDPTLMVLSASYQRCLLRVIASQVIKLLCQVRTKG